MISVLFRNKILNIIIFFLNIMRFSTYLKIVEISLKIPGYLYLGLKLSNVWSSIILRSGKSLTSFYTNKHANFYGGKSTTKLFRVYEKKKFNSNLVLVLKSKGDVTREDSQQRFLAQHRVVALLQHCFEWWQHCSNIARLCFAKNRRCESSRVTSP